MLHLHDRATMARALKLDLDPQLHALLAERIAGLATGDQDLTDWTEYLVVEPGDTETDILRHVGFSPLLEPIDGARFGDDDFAPYWDWLSDQGGWYELIITFGSTFAYVLFIRDAEGVLSDLRSLCRHYAGSAEQ